MPVKVGSLHWCCRPSLPQYIPMQHRFDTNPYFGAPMTQNECYSNIIAPGSPRKGGQFGQQPGIVYDGWDMNDLLFTATGQRVGFARRDRYFCHSSDGAKPGAELEAVRYALSQRAGAVKLTTQTRLAAPTSPVALGSTLERQVVSSSMWSVA